MSITKKHETEFLDHTKFLFVVYSALHVFLLMRMFCIWFYTRCWKLHSYVRCSVKLASGSCMRLSGIKPNYHNTFITWIWCGFEAMIQWHNIICKFPWHWSSKSSFKELKLLTSDSITGTKYSYLCTASIIISSLVQFIMYTFPWYSDDLTDI